MDFNSPDFKSNVMTADKLFTDKIFNKLASDSRTSKAKMALEANGVNVIVVENGAEAKAAVLALLPDGAEVMDMSSVTLEATGLQKEIRESGKYDSVKKRLATMDRATQGREMRKLGAAPDYALGSVHAITEDGSLLIASNTGSQLSAYVYDAGKVIWVTGTQKIVKNFDEGLKRIYEYVLPLESEHMRQVYKAPGSFVSKLLVINREITPDRLTLVLVKEIIGF